MQDVKKTVLWVLVGFCMISVLVGIFNLIAFLQMSTTKISQISLEDAESTFFMANTLAAILCAILCVVLVLIASMKFLKNGVSAKPKFILGLLIVALVICVLFIVYPFLTPTILKAGNDTFDSFSGSGYFFYGTFSYYQSYLSATLSTFIPLFIATGLVLGNVICRIKFQKPAEAEHTEPENK